MRESSPPPAKEIKLKKDCYRRSRGGNAELLSLSCTACGKLIMLYQKDGLGNLFRTYLDRIVWPPELANLDNDPNISTKQDMDNLVCPYCNSVVGIPMLYEPEKRLAFRMRRGKFKKAKWK
jgi:hypothetical protein